MPILHAPGVMIPGQFGPMSRALGPCASRGCFEHAPHLDHVHDGDALGDAHDEREPAVERLENGIRGPRRRNEDAARVRPGRLHRLRDGVEDGH